MLTWKSGGAILVLAGVGLGGAAVAARARPAPARPAGTPDPRAAVREGTAALAQALDARFGPGTAAGLRIVAAAPEGTRAGEAAEDAAAPGAARRRALREAALAVAARLDALAHHVAARRVATPAEAHDRYRAAFVEMGRTLDAGANAN